MPDSLTIIRQEIAKGHVVRARKILRILLEETPTAPLWYLASTICESREQELGCLRQALKIDPNHLQARERYIELKKPKAPPQEMPPLVALVEDLPEPAPVPTPEPDPFSAKHLHRKRSQRRWTMVGLAASLIMSVSSTYFLLTVLGSPIPAQIRAFVSGQSSNDKAGNPVFGTQTGSGQLNTPTAPMLPVSATQENYSAEAVAGGFMVRPNKTEDLQAEKPVNDVLDPGFAHEYVINAKQGDELAIAVQFFSPTAHKVAANMGILDPDGYNAASQCERGQILTDGSSVTYICKIHKSGNWKVQLFGHSGESTGVYVLTYQRM